jgi:hypothetical protein
MEVMEVVGEVGIRGELMAVNGGFWEGGQGIYSFMSRGPRVERRGRLAEEKVSGIYGAFF